MLTFKQYLRESDEHAGVRKHLDSLPTEHHDKKWLDDSQIKHFGNKQGEVRTEHVAKMVTKDHISQKGSHGHKPPFYEKTELQHVPLDKIHYNQPHVNKGKLAHLAKHYHPKAEDFHTTHGELRKHEAPHVNKYPDGSYTSHDHHRLIASHLRGDKHAIARVTTWDHDGRGGYKQVKTKKDKDLG